MGAAIKAAVLTLLAIAAIVLIGVFLKSFIDYRHRQNINRSAAKKMTDAYTGPAPIPAASSKPGSAEVGTTDESIRTRFLAMGAIVVAVIGTLLVKLWSMQILSSDTYSMLAEENRTTTFTTRAVRGRILDRNGVELVGNRATLAVVATSDVANDRNVVHRLSNVLGIPRAAIKQRIQDTSEGAQADRLVADDVPMRAAAFISEHPTAFAGVTIEARSTRTYPNGSLAAHVLGYTGTISEDELETLKTADGNSYESGDVVGKSGAEAAFESVLQGIRGTRTVEVDAQGTVQSLVEEIESRKGNDVMLALDLDAQRVAEQALLAAFEQAKVFGFVKANAGSIVAIDLEDGGVVAMASYPTFDPNQFIGGISSELWDLLNSAASGYPLTNRAISGVYPAASTFKAFSGMAGLKYGYADAKTQWTCEGIWYGFGEQWPKKCWLESGHGTLGIIDAYPNSCDVVFYEIAKAFYENIEKQPNVLQEDLMSWGFGSKTGIELSGEAAGRIPTAAWKAEYNKDTPESAMWLPGDMANLIIGQGDILITPLQNAVCYSGIALGECLKPHILKSVLSESGEPVISAKREVFRTPQFEAKNIDLVRQGVHKVTSSYEQFADFSVDTAGKTGTGEVTGKDDLGWYVGYGPFDKPKYLVSCCVEQCGGGASICMPAVRKVLASLFDVEDGEISDNTMDESR